jgi:preprotein translocase subunit YajC
MSLINFVGISNAWAEVTQTAATSGATTTPTSTTGSILHMLPMLILFILVFYFLLVRPQAKRAKEQKKLLSNVTVGDEVMSTGGIIGRVARLKDNYVVLLIAKGVEITVQKSSIVSILPKGTMEITE